MIGIVGAYFWPIALTLVAAEPGVDAGTVIVVQVILLPCVRRPPASSSPGYLACRLEPHGSDHPSSQKRTAGTATLRCCTAEVGNLLARRALTWAKSHFEHRDAHRARSLSIIITLGSN